MKLTHLVSSSLLTLALAACSSTDTPYYLPINDALKSPDAKGIIDPNIAMYFGKSAPGKIIKANVVTNRKTNSAMKDDQKACRWAFFAAVKQLQEQAQSQGAAKVSNIVSYYKKKTYSSTDTYECHSGNIIAGVALKADIVK